MSTMNAFNITAILTLNTSKFNQALSESGGKASMFGDMLKANLVSSAVTKGLDLLVDGIQKVASGFANVVKSAYDAYGDYEQLTGGIETLFGSAAQKVMQDANEAYKSAGMSVNEYMETSIQSAAALINSLGGDQAAAADLMNMSITDMADNVNKMGTTMEGVQNAYRGFSRGNFTMLDNLALGFAGTKEGMEELLAKAEEFAAANGEMRDYSIDSYADIVEAIHVVQTNMGITGTTAKEASKTVQGSVKAVKSAWQNLVTGLGDPNADLGLLIQNVVDAGITALDNIVPVIERVLTGIGDAITKVAPIITQKLPELASRLLPPLIKAVSALIKGLVQALPALIEVLIQAAFDILNSILEMLPDIISTLAEAIPQIITTLITTLMDNLPTIIQGLVSVVLAIVQAIPTIIIGLIEALPTIIVSIITALIESLPILIQGLIQMVLAIVEALPEIIRALIDAIPQIIEAVATVIKEDFLPILQAVGEGLWSIIQSIGAWFLDLVTQLGTWLAGIWSSIVEWFSGLISSIVSWFAGIAESIASFFVGIWTSVTSWLANLWQSVVSFFTNIISGIVGFVGNIASTVANFFVGIWNSVTGWLSNLLSNIWNFITQIPTKIAQGLSSIWQVGRNLVTGLWNGIAGAASWLWEKITGWASSILGGIKSFFGIKSPSKEFAWIGQMLDEGLAGGIDKYANLAIDSATALSEGVNDAVDVGGDLDVSSVGGEGTGIGGASVVINVYGAEGQDVDELATIISEKIQRMINRNGAVYA